MEAEGSFVFEKEDLVTLRPGRETSVVDGFVERMLKTFHCSAIEVSDSIRATPVMLS